MFDRIDIAPAYKVVSERIEAEILSGRLVPGRQLPTETQLATQFNVTRHTVREGIRILEQSGFVQRAGGRRLYVSLPHYSELAPRSSRALVMNRVTFRELWVVSLALEPVAARLAAERVTPEFIAKLRENLAAMIVEIEAGRSVSALDVEFHTMIAEITGNRALQLSREPISLLFYPALERIFSHPKTRNTAPLRLLEAHTRIVDAFDSGDTAEAELWMNKHMADFRRGYEACGLDLDEPVDFIP